jgi:dihydrolipoamide dehydrogenase
MIMEGGRNMSEIYDLVVIGSGPGGHIAAINAAKFGMKVVIIEKDVLGGVCLNVGCIPSKALIKQAEYFTCIPKLEAIGVSVDLTRLEYQLVHEKSRQAVEKLAKGLAFHLKKSGVEVIYGEGKITGAKEVVVNGKKIETKHILIATGSRPIEIPGWEFDSKRIVSSTDVLNLKELPKSMIILGGGVVGVELAYVLSTFGVDVHIVEMMKNILPREDEEIVRVLNRELKKKGIKISTSTKVIDIEKKDDEGLVATLEDLKKNKMLTEYADMLFIAVGRKPNSEKIGIEELEVAVKNGFVEVNSNYQTNISSIYAIGDVIDTPMLAHVASREGELAVEHMLGKEIEKIDNLSVPSVVYAEPQIASFGYSEERLKEKEIPYEKAVHQYRANGKAVAVGEVEGLVKVFVHQETKKLLGVHIVGKQATEIIHELLLAKNADMKLEDIINVVHAHPTFSELLREAVLSF